MQTATIYQLKKELELLDGENLLQICLRLARFRKENKELLTYLIFESHQEEKFRIMIKGELEEQVNAYNKSTTYYIKKGVRKTIRYLDKVIRFSGQKETEIELRLHFLRQLKAYKIPIRNNKVLMNMWNRQAKKIEVVMEKVHEDLQYDYREELKEITVF